MCANRKNADPAAPPNPRCSRPPCLGDFPRHPVRTVRLLHSVALAGRSAELLRWAGGFLGLLLQLASAARTSTGNAREPPCRSHKRVHHLLSSTHRRSPATLRLFLTASPYASPSRGSALRHCLHGSPRLILAVLARAFALPKALCRCVPTAKRPPLPPRPTSAAADRPLAAIFHVGVCRVPSRSTPWPSSGGRLSFSVGQAAFLVSGFRSAAQRRLHQQRAYTAVPLIKPRPSSSLVDPQWHSSQPLRVPHPRRACFAVARRRASPVASRRATAHSCRARP
jgi:hypothetical protein